jgi:hypothetical protein
MTEKASAMTRSTKEITAVQRANTDDKNERNKDAYPFDRVEGRLGGLPQQTSTIMRR